MATPHEEKNGSFTIASKIEDKDIYKFAFDTRNFEISMFWQRSNYFLVLNSGLALGFFNVKSPGYSILLAIFGIITSALWFQVNIGSKYWQSRWEHRLHEVEKVIAPELKFFAASKDEVQKDVQDSLNYSNHTGLQKWLDSEILKKPSVSYCMTLLSLFFIAGWVALILIFSKVTHW